MTNFEYIKAMDIDTIANWIDEQAMSADEPWYGWFDAVYCDNCEPEKCHVTWDDNLHDITYCEMNNECRFFKGRKPLMPKEIIRLWLESEHY